MSANQSGDTIAGGGAASAIAAPFGAGGSAIAGKVQRRTSGNKNHSRSYPRGVGLDFRKLAGLSLLNYIDHHGMYIYGWVCCFSLVVLKRLPHLFC
jgi:hypothetical protein